MCWQNNCLSLKFKTKQMKQTGLLIILGLAFFVLSCDKNQKAVNKLEGSWKATNYIWTDVEEGGASDDIVAGEDAMTMTFEDCKLKSGNGCKAVWVITDLIDGVVTTIDYDSYKVSDDGKTLEFYSDSWDDETWAVTELTKSNLKLQQFNSSGEFQIDLYLEKD